MLPARDGSALLIDADEGRDLETRTDGRVELGDLARRLEVAREQDDAARLDLREHRPCLGVDGRPRDADEQELPHALVDRHRPFARSFSRAPRTSAARLSAYGGRATPRSVMMAVT